MNQVVYAAGQLWGALNTVVRTSKGASSQTPQRDRVFRRHPVDALRGFGPDR